jgi:flagellar assembly protein FliH
MSESSRARGLAAAAAPERWSLPAVNGPIVGASRRDVDPAQAARAMESDRSRGYEAGLAAARAEVERLTADLQARAQRLESILGLLARPLATLDEQVERQLTLLALAIGKQLARRELKANPQEIIPLIRDCVGRLPAFARDVRVHLHPDDAALVRERLAAPEGERAWKLIEDPTLSRGGCLVRAEDSQIDARLESRVGAVAASLFGEDRASPRGTGSEAT